MDLYLQGLLKKHEVFETDFQVHRDRCSEVQKEGEKLMEEVSGWAVSFRMWGGDREEGFR